MFKLLQSAYTAWTSKQDRQAEAIYAPPRSANGEPVREPDVYLVSFPKCGRTWLRLLIGKALALHYNVADDSDILELEPLTARLPGVPVIRVTHDDTPQKKGPDELSTDKSEYRGKRVIFLVRDPRDVVVSMYFQNKYRVRVPRAPVEDLADIQRFAASRVGSLDTVLAYYKIWARERSAPCGFLLLRYEDMHSDPKQALRSVLDFLGLSSVGDSVLERAVEYCRFENMRQMEVEGRFKSPRLAKRGDSDPNALKTRRGDVGGYRDYFDAETLSKIDRRIASELPELFGYY